MSELAVTYSTNAAEQARATRQILRYNRTFWVGWLFFTVLPLATVLFVVVIRGWNPRLWQLLIAGIVGGLFWHFIPWIGVLSMRRGFPTPNGPYSWSFSDVEALFVGPGARVQLAWPAIIKARESREFLLLYQGKNVAHFIPKRALSTDQLARVKAVVAGHGVPCSWSSSGTERTSNRGHR